MRSFSNTKRYSILLAFPFYGVADLPFLTHHRIFLLKKGVSEFHF
ncbi:hypothetical protein C2W58_02665 [Bacillus pumilus]|uniref:Uncharacterized protein n=1 Tax=Bacillus pumilus TaxID=1408 RepID=A0AB34QVU2_BACPU|nr:hypothetical protein B4127_4151 [Bacillus pumilus]RAP03909.1 hypothetical protein C2W58_02665 [Bacillus pumilus]